MAFDKIMLVHVFGKRKHSIRKNFILGRNFEWSNVCGFILFQIEG